MADITDILSPISFGVNLISGLFNNANKERTIRYRNYLRTLSKLREKRLAETYRGNANLIGNDRQAAVSRAAAAGRTGETESYVLPAQDRAATIANQNVVQANQPFDEAALNAEADYENRPIEPNALDVLGEGVGQAAQYALQRKRIDLIKNLNASTSNSPVDGGSPSQPGAFPGDNTIGTTVPEEDQSDFAPPTRYLPYWKRPQSRGY